MFWSILFIAFSFSPSSFASFQKKPLATIDEESVLNKSLEKQKDFLLRENVREKRIQFLMQKHLLTINPKKKPARKKTRCLSNVCELVMNFFDTILGED
jgi:hypothetical protein